LLCRGASLHLFLSVRSKLRRVVIHAVDARGAARDLQPHGCVSVAEGAGCVRRGASAAGSTRRASGRRGETGRRTGRRSVIITRSSSSSQTTTRLRTSTSIVDTGMHRNIDMRIYTRLFHPQAPRLLLRFRDSRSVMAARPSERRRMEGAHFQTTLSAPPTAAPRMQSMQNI
jgi:hypothetical protein